MIELRGYIAENGNKRFAQWLEALDAAADCQRPVRMATASNAGDSIMPLTHDFKETIRARAQRDPRFRQALLREAVECVINGDLATGKAVLRDYVNATIGFQKLEKRTRIPAKSLMRMLGPKGSPSAANLSSILTALQRTEGVQFQLTLRR
jgi:DNA-binding phage protein